MTKYDKLTINTKTKEIRKMKELDEEQEKVIKVNLDKQIIVNAPPGTGKTYTVSKKIEYIIENRIATLDEILVICFSRSAVKEIKNRIQISEENKKEITIRTIDSFCSWIIKEIEEENYKKIFSSTTFDDRIKYVKDLLQENKNFQKSIKKMKHIIIDEVQDIVRNKSRVSIRVIKNI